MHHCILFIFSMHKSIYMHWLPPLHLPVPARFPADSEGFFLKEGTGKTGLHVMNPYGNRNLPGFRSACFLLCPI